MKDLRCLLGFHQMIRVEHSIPRMMHGLGGPHVCARGCGKKWAGFPQSVLARTIHRDMEEDYRPTFGAFDAKLELAGVVKDGVRGDAKKPRDQDEATAHKAFVGRIREAA